MSRMTTTGRARDEVLEEAAKECEKLAQENRWGPKYLGAIWSAYRIRALKETPEAAATITSLREELDRARKALEPFAAKAKEIGLDTPRFKNLLELTDKFTFKRSDLRAAAAAMGEDKK